MNLRCFLGFHRSKIIVQRVDDVVMVTQGCLRCGEWWYKTAYRGLRLTALD